MKYLLGRVQKGFSECRFPEDVKRLFNIALSNGYIFPCDEIESIWEEFSEEHGAQWLILDAISDSELLKVIQNKWDDGDL